MNIQDIFFFGLLLAFFVLIPIAGIYNFFYTSHAISLSQKILKKINIYGIEPKLDLSSSPIAHSYKIVGFLLLLLSICFVAPMIYTTLDAIFNGGSICIGSVDQCWEF